MSFPSLKMPITQSVAMGMIALALALSVFSVPSAQAQGRFGQGDLRDAAAQGQVLPLNRLVAMVQAKAPYRDMEYLGGPEIDPSTMVYRLKFLNGKKVVLVFVDGRTGRVLKQQ